MRARHWLRGLFAFVLSSTAIGCIDITPDHVRTAHTWTEPPNEETSMNDLPHGMAKRNDFAVRVYRTGRGSGSCSGALVGDRIVITALHCVVDLDAHSELTTHVKSPANLHVELGGGYLPWGRVGVIGIRTCDGWKMTADGDVAALLLAAPVPSDVPILAIADAPPVPGDELRTYGFGSETSKLIPDTDIRLESVKRHIRAHTAFDVADGDILMSGGVIHGDSGGPIINVTTGELVAVVSQGTDGRVDPKREEDRKAGIEPQPLPSDVTTGARIDRCRDVLAF